MFNIHNYRENELLQSLLLECKYCIYYNFHNIEKSYELNADKTIKKDSIVYTAYDSEGNLFDGSKTLSQLKRKIDNIYR